MRFFKKQIIRLIRWSIITFAVKTFLKSRASKSAQQAAEDFQENLPPSIASAVDSLPPKVKAAAGSAIIAGKSIKKVASAATGGSEDHVFKRRLQKQKNRVPQASDEVQGTQIDQQAQQAQQ